MDFDQLMQLVLQGGAIVALAWVLTLLTGGRLHTSSEVDGLRKDKADLLTVNQRLGEALDQSNRLLEKAIDRGSGR